MSNQENVRVLIAEDDYLVGEMIKGLLEEAGYTVIGEAADGLEVIEMVQSLRPDVVLMDIGMPEIDGVEATRLIYEHCPTPVVVLTAYETEELVERASAAGVGAYLVKPPNVPEVERAIAIAMARFGDMVELRDYAGQLEQRVRERTAQFQAQYARLDAILSSTTDGIVVTDRQGEIIQANPVAQAWLTQTLSPEGAARLREGVRDLARQVAAETAGTGAAGGERPGTVLELKGLDLELRAAPISPPPAPSPDCGGREGGEAVVVVDIHDVSYLKALDRMKARFVTNISHELRTPITTAKLYTALLQRISPEQSEEKWRQYLDALAQETDWLARLVQDILQISHIDTGRLEMKPRPVFLDELSETTVASHRALAQERGLTLDHLLEEPGTLASSWPEALLGDPDSAGLGLGRAQSSRRAVEPSVPLVTLVDPERMVQVLNNLVGNAIRYTPEGGKVVVSVGKKELDGRAWATVTVADTGMGIPEEELPHVFERFFRGEKPRTMQLSGTGLGLAIVKEIVELHGGRVTVESEVDAGTIFTVWLPLAGAGV